MSGIDSAGLAIVSLNSFSMVQYIVIRATKYGIAKTDVLTDVATFLSYAVKRLILSSMIFTTVCVCCLCVC